MIEFTWANRPNLARCRDTNFALIESQWRIDFGRELDAVKRLAKEAKETCEGDSILTVVVGIQEFKRLVEAVQGL